MIIKYHSNANYDCLLPNINFLSQKYQLHFTDEEIAALKQTEPKMIEHLLLQALSNMLCYMSERALNTKC